MCKQAEQRKIRILPIIKTRIPPSHILMKKIHIHCNINTTIKKCIKYGLYILRAVQSSRRVSTRMCIDLVMPIICVLNIIFNNKKKRIKKWFVRFYYFIRWWCTSMWRREISTAPSFLIILSITAKKIQYKTWPN